MTIQLDPDDIIIPLQAESVAVSKREVVTARVRVCVETKTSQKTITEDLIRHTVDVEHVEVGTLTDTMPQPREEGDVLIIPIVEEVIVRRFLIREEVRIRRNRFVEQHSEQVTLHHQDVVVTREAEPAVADFTIPITTET
ncbi:DUF2382 domain-containing protein [Acidisoma cladoniae]|uniref:DUF2382 domain-containing protein n=1 Tax=Acidisoma cladoniae TaxID=3040935 RepID=UPI00254E6C69|nr:DUF2382 domain-containing protein [Acidisoma sp. PAMC 29798]